MDFEENSRIKYSLSKFSSEFIIGESDGVVKVNLSNISSTRKEDFQLTVVATDCGNPPLHSSVSLRVKVNGESAFENPFNKKDYRYVFSSYLLVYNRIERNKRRILVTN